MGDTHIWGLDYSFLREAALRRQKKKTLFSIGGVDRDVTALDASQYFSLMVNSSILTLPN